MTDKSFKKYLRLLCSVLLTVLAVQAIVDLAARTFYTK
jgi:hypothetical protein